MTEKEKDEIVEGIIINVDFGFNMKYKDMENLYLKLEIQQFDGYEAVQLFKAENVGKLLVQFRGDYRGELSLNHLQHKRVFLLKSDSTNGVPNAIAKLPPEQYPQYQWVRNNNWDWAIAQFFP